MNIQLAEQVYKEAKNVQSAFQQQNNMYWSLEACIDALKDKKPFNEYSPEIFKLAALMEQKDNYSLN